nr:hypothetical protein [Tanacetum cinerariifolium]
GKVSSIPTVLSWVDIISSDGFLPSILLLVVVIVTVIIVVVMVILIFVIVTIVKVVFVVAIIGVVVGGGGVSSIIKLSFVIIESLHPKLPGPEEPIVEFPKGKVGVYTKFFEFENFHLFSLISALNPAKVKTETRPQVAHEVPLLTATASRVIDMEDTAVASGSLGTPSVVDKSPLDFADEDPPQVITKRSEEATTEVIPELSLEKEVAGMGPVVNKRRRKRGNKGAEANAPPKVLRKDYATSRPAQSTRGEKSIVPIGLDAGLAFSMPTSAAKSMSYPDPLSYAEPQPHPERDIAQSSRETDTEVPTGHVATTKVQGHPKVSINRVGRDQQLMSGYPKRVPRHGRPRSTTGVAMGSPLRLRFEQEVRLLKKATTKIAERDQRIKAREGEIKKLDQEIKSLRTVETKVHDLRNLAKNLETLLEAEVDMKKAAEAKNARLAKELESLRAQFADLQVSNNHLSQQVSTLRAQVTCEERIKAAFKEFKKYEDDRVNSRCVEMDARLDALSIYFNEELYPHMVTAIAAKGMSEGLKHEIEHGKANLDLAAIEVYDLEADAKYVIALHALKDLKYPIVDQLKKLKDAPIDLIMASLYLESDSGEDAPQWIRELRSSSSKLKILVYPEPRRKKEEVSGSVPYPWVGSAHHARSDGIPVSVHTIAPQGLSILLADAAMQTKISKDEASPRLLRSKSLPPVYNLD